MMLSITYLLLHYVPMARLRAPGGVRRAGEGPGRIVIGGVLSRSGGKRP
ncbi:MULTISPECIES: hypothetical protein [unclassified Frankia]